MFLKETVIDIIENGLLDDKLNLLYSLSEKQPNYEETIKQYRDRYIDLIKGFREEFPDNQSEEIRLFSAPGRTEIGGNHTDHQLGSVLAGSVNYDVIAAVSPNDKNVIRLFSDGYGLTEIDLDELEPIEEEKETTASLVRGMAGEIKKLGYDIDGFDAYSISNVPSGSGISSSAAFEVLLGNIISALSCDHEIDKVNIAKIGQITENEYFGKPSGLMDQMASSVGSVVGIDFADQENPVIEEVELNLNDKDYSLVIIDTRSSHADLTDEYAAIPQEMKAIAASFDKEVLSQVDYDEFLASLPELRNNFSDRSVLRALHYFNDTQRAKREKEALAADDFDEFLRLVNESGNSSILSLQNIWPAGNVDDQSVAVALSLANSLLNGRGASRVHGGGFAGTIQAFVPNDIIEEFVQGMDTALGEGASKIMSIRQVGGTEIS